MKIRFSGINKKHSAIRSMVASGAIVLAAMAINPATAADSNISIEKPHRYADVYLDTDRITGSMTLNVNAVHVGATGDLFLVAMVNDDDDTLFMKTAAGWRRWDGTIAGLEPIATRSLSAMETLPIVSRQNLLAGSYRLAAAYGVDGELIFSGKAMSFQVNDADGSSLQRFSSAQAMSDYIREGMQNSGKAGYAYPSFITSLVEDAAASSSGNLRVSTTNLQETGVDEADTIKTDGDNLYVLSNCDFSPCLDVYGLDGSQASATLKAGYVLDNTTAPDGMYLIQDQPGSDQLITVSGMNQFYAWYDVWGWGGNSTEIEFFNADQPENLVSREKLTFDGSLVSSRRVGDTLYVVTRYTPFVENYVPLPLDDREEEANADLLEKTSLSQLVPQVRDTRDEVLDLVSARQCYLPVNAVDTNLNPSIITITGIPIGNPTAFTSTCFLGGTETLYMTTDSLYLATTRWDYERLAADSLVYNPDHTTAIHKFALANGGIEYRGSGEVKGHLGWTEDKKSFRMGENGAYLNVVTSVGDSWGESASTRLTVLKESGVSNELETVSITDGIGKPGEQLYAARFLGDRAYLVTFRVIDPLYVLDLSDQENPAIVGELEIDGYSDYLQPISENLLLGIGKDAIADDGTSASGRNIDFGGRGAWYQGVKLSLFDVSNPASPTEIDAVVLGKRGTESAVLWDHHALSFIPGTGSEPARLAIPVQLHADTPQWEGWDASDPGAWYDYTHTALYSFELSALGIAQTGRIISEKDNGDDFVIALDDDVVTRTDDKAEDKDSNGSDLEPVDPVELPTRLIAPVFNYYSDRSVLLDDAVFYIHDGEVLTSFWGEDRDVTD